MCEIPLLHALAMKGLRRPIVKWMYFWVMGICTWALFYYHVQASVIKPLMSRYRKHSSHPGRWGDTSMEPLMEKGTRNCSPGPEDFKTVLNTIRWLREPQHVRIGMDLRSSAHLCDAWGKGLVQNCPVHQLQIWDRNPHPLTGSGHGASSTALRTPGNLYRDSQSLRTWRESSLKPPEEMRVKTISTSPSWQTKDTASWQMFWWLWDARVLGESCLEDREMA